MQNNDLIMIGNSPLSNARISNGCGGKPAGFAIPISWLMRLKKKPINWWFNSIKPANEVTSRYSRVAGEFKARAWATDGQRSYRWSWTVTQKNQRCADTNWRDITRDRRAERRRVMAVCHPCLTKINGSKNKKMSYPRHLTFLSGKSRKHQECSMKHNAMKHNIVLSVKTRAWTGPIKLDSSYPGLSGKMEPVTDSITLSHPVR